jgi:hypothetical protein
MSEQSGQGQPAPDPDGGVRLTLRDASGQVIATVGSAADGVYSFNGLLSNPPPAPPSQLSGSVYLDVNRDGQRGPGEPGYAGVAVQLSGTDSAGKAVRLQATTDADGRYLFDGLGAGFYRLEVLSAIPNTQPGRNHLGTLGGQEQGAALQVAIQAGQVGERYDFARVLPAQPAAPPAPAPQPDPRPAAPASAKSTLAARDMFFSVLGMGGNAPILGGTQLGTGPIALPTAEAASTLSGYVFHDRDNDGALGEGDAGIIGVEVTIEGTTQKGAPLRRSAVTGEDGAFTFTDLPSGTYSLSRRHTGAYVAGRSMPGTVNGTAVGQPAEEGIRGIVLASGALGLNYRFAEVRSCGLTGVVCAEDELDEDGPQETPLEGVTLILSGTDDAGRAAQLTAKTDGRGQYRFRDLFPGKYDLYAAPMKGWAAKEARPGDKGGRASGPGKLSAVALRSGDTGTRYNFKVRGTANVVGRVSLPTGPAANAWVRLGGQDEAGNEVNRVIQADAQGAYRFEHLPAGEYEVTAGAGGKRVTLAPGATAGCDLSGDPGA